MNRIKFTNFNTLLFIDYIFVVLAIILAFYFGSNLSVKNKFSARLVSACSCTCQHDDWCSDGSSSPSRGCDTGGSKNSCSGSCTDESDGSCTCGGTCADQTIACTNGRCGAKYPGTIVCGNCGGGGGTPGCFIAKTQITMADGTHKNIEDVQSGDYIKTLNDNGVEIIDKVTSLEHTDTFGYYRIILADGTELHVTDNHPIWSKVGNTVGWGSLDPLLTKLYDKMEVQRIKIGDYVYKDDKSWVKVTGKEFQQANLTVYNLKLSGDPHSYFADGVYVHNKGGGGCSDSSPATPTLTSPANAAQCFSSNVIPLVWAGISSWGTNCAGNNNQYEVWIDGARVTTVGSGVTTYNYTGTWGTSHNWYIKATNGARTSTSSTWSFSVTGCTRIIGRVWEDINADNAFSGPAEAWSYNPPPAANCSALLDNDIMVRSPSGGANVLSSWACNSASYYQTSYFTLNGPTGTYRSVSVSLDTPDSVDYPASYVNWSYASCAVSGCATTGNIASGNGTNVATVNIGNMNGQDASNHLQWMVVKNKPPTASITTSVDTSHTFLSPVGQLVNVVPAGASQSFVANAIETRATSAWRLAIARRPFTPATRVAPTDAATYVVLGTNNACSGLNCAATFADASSPAGYYVYYPIATDEIAVSTGVVRVTNQCNGHPGVNSGAVTGQADCDPVWGDGYQDETVVFGDNIPVCRASGITGPTYLFSYPVGATYVYPESIGFYNVSTYDLDNTEVKHVWNPNWTNPDGLYPTITQIRIYAAGTTNQGVGPTMQLWLGNNANGGIRTKAQEWVVSNINPTYAAFTANGTFNNVSSIDIAFPNDASDGTGDRNLFIQRIEVTYEASPGKPLVRTLYPYTEANTGSVYYDRGTQVAAPYNLSGEWFDGNSYSLVTQASGAFGVAAGVMAWSGSYNFPIPIRSNTSGGALTLNSTPMSTLPYYNGNPCSGLAISSDANPTYTITGTAYQRNTSQVCSAQNISADTKVQNTTVTLKDSSTGTMLSSLTATTDSNGNYTISNIPVAYRPSTYCPTCGVNVCLQQQTASVGVYLAACSQVMPPAAAPNNAWGDSALCSPQVSTTPQITVGTVATVNLGLDYYQNEKWSTVLDGDVYAPGITFDIATVPGTTFSPYVINRRVDSGTTTMGGFTFIDDTNVDLGLPLTQTNLSEYGGYAIHLRNTTNTFDFKDKWLASYSPVAPAGAVSTDPRSGSSYVFNSSNVYSYSLAQFNSWYSAAGFTSYDVTGSYSVAFVYVIGDATTERLNLNKSVRTSDQNEMIILVTNLPIDIPDTVDVDKTKLDGNTYTVNSSSFGAATDQLTEGFLDFVLLSTGEINIHTRYNDLVDPTVYDLPIMIYGSVISQDSVLLNRDLWHIYNSKYPSEMVRYNNRLLPSIMSVINGNPGIANFTGLGTFDIQTVYE